MPVNYSKEKGLLYLGSCFKHACLASPSNGPQIDMLPEQTLLIPPVALSLLLYRLLSVLSGGTCK